MPRLLEGRLVAGRLLAIARSLGLAAGVATALDATAADPAPPPKRPTMISEAALPDGFPPPGPVGEVIVKTYPPHRLARTRAASGQDDRMFQRLFGHIKRNDIAMTAPVTMDWSGDSAAPQGSETMAFLYARPDMGTPGPDPADAAVMVEDVPEMTVASIGIRGAYGRKTYDAGVETLEAWCRQHPEWKVAGPPRLLGYNSPFVPWFARYAEVQIPLEPAPREP
jgi:hypothetical protein